jgi:Icc-related predicted phosphoesterase
MIEGIPFVGAPLWFRKKENYKAYSAMLNDFQLISNFEDRIFKENKKSLKFLDWHVTKDSIVITHHVPTAKSTPARYVGDPVNMFFLCDMEGFIKERKPKLWIHGHTHDSFNYMLESTHMVCNPLGYVGHQVNPEFIPNMMIDL